MSRIPTLPRQLLYVLLGVIIVATAATWANQDKKGNEKTDQEVKRDAAPPKKEAAAAATSAPTPTAAPTAPAPPATTKPTAATANPSAPSTAAGGEGAGAANSVAVTRGPLSIELTLSGNLEATAMTEVSIVPKQWGQLVVAEVVPAGTRVSKGQTLLKLDTTKIDEAIRDLEATRALAELNLRQAVENQKLLEKSAPLDAELAERTKKNAEQDYDLYVKVDAPQLKKTADFQLRSSEQNLEYVNEELKQLEKMYKADDLTEETEEIILKRARNDVDRAQFSTELARNRHERTTTVDLPRGAEQQKYTLQQAVITWEKSRLTLPALQQRQKLELEKMQLEHKKSEDKLAELKRDGEMLTIAAPVDGVVYYGRSQNGKWVGAGMMAQKFRPGGQVAPYETLFTIVSEGPWVVRSSVSERDLATARPGMAGRAKLAAYPKNRFAVKVRDVASVPGGDGSFDMTLDVAGPLLQPLIAGMSCEVKLGVYFNADTITVPTKAVFSEEPDDEKQFVYLVSADGTGKPEKRAVVTGQSKGDMTEIVSGLSGGDKVLLQKPAP